ncbi:hypothetical protein [Anabaena sp. CCY 9402-a]|uniref:hypothetical protein n=1 Tax=Anabaena sp. CCY 9402-a TaxID=3103867 RepID=UPI0039C73A0C
MKLKSARVARVMLWLLRISLILTVFSTFFKLIYNSISASHSTITTLLYLFSLPSIFINLAILLLSLVWIYLLHEDLHHCYDDYPINSWNALWSLIFIIFIWKTLITIARYFRAETGRLHRYGLRLYRLVPVIYAIFIASYLLRRLIYKYDYLGRPESIRNIPEFLVLIAIACKNILELGGVIVLVIIAQTIVNAMQLKVNQINHQVA